MSAVVFDLADARRRRDAGKPVAAVAPAPIERMVQAQVDWYRAWLDALAAVWVRPS